MDSVDAEIKAADTREEELKGRLDRVETERQGAEATRGTLERELGQHAITRAHKASELDHLKSTIARLEAEVGDIEAAREHAQGELDEIATRREAARAEIAAKEEEIKALVQQRDSLRERRIEIENRRGEVRQRIADRREEVHQTREAQRVRQEATQKLRLRLNEQNLRVEDIIGKGRDEHDQDIVQLHQEYEEPDVDWDEVRHEMGELKRKLDNMGTVNLLAIEEQTELEQRADFLSSQEQDLLKAKHSLQEVIRKVNRQSRQLFEQTFNAVRTNFQELFRKLFRGGRADILLEPDMDILEAGVEIVAKPPGKEQTRLSLLSGGEKSLTAAALLLAIFKSKPSPFCILDEVDAALDDANIGRFVGMLREFVKESQFILITHSKQTMSIADALYGITMQEPGVSTKMGVRLDDVVHEPQVA
jgi:chromosome segregation protein